MYKTTQNSALQFAQQCADMAQQYTNFGFSVIPLTRGTKQPALSSWAEFQTKRPTLTEVQTWWDSGQQYGIAIVCGKVSGVVVLDIDDTDKFGVARNNIGETLPDTPIVRTRKGWHVYFKYPQTRIVRRHDRLSDWGAELRGDGCCVTAPPTTIDGHRYHWAKRNGRLMALGQVPLADPPDWLLDAFGVPFVNEAQNEPTPSQPKTQATNATLSPEQKSALKAILVQHWIEGQRHDLALGLAGLLAKSSISQDDALSLLREIAAEANDSEWRDRERALKDSFDRLWRNEPIVGFKRLEDILGDQTAEVIASIVSPRKKTNGKANATVGLLTLAEWDERLAHIAQGEWLVEGLLRAGWLLVLNARPKVGKSIVAVNLATALANGDAFLNCATSSCAVVYIDLERPLETLSRFKTLGALGNPNIFVPNERVGADLVDTLRDLIRQAKERTNRPVVVFVDTLGDFIKPALRQRKASINDYDAIAEILQSLRDLALETGCAFVFIHHLRKAQTDEPSEVDVLGSTAIAGKFDVIAHLHPDRTDASVLSLVAEGNAIVKTVLHFAIEDTLKLRPCEPPAKTKEEQAAKAILDYLQQRNYATRHELIRYLIEIGLANPPAAGKQPKAAETLLHRAMGYLQGKVVAEQVGRHVVYRLAGSPITLRNAESEHDRTAGLPSTFNDIEFEGSEGSPTDDDLHHLQHLYGGDEGSEGNEGNRLGELPSPPSTPIEVKVEGSRFNEGDLGWQQSLLIADEPILPDLLVPEPSSPENPTTPDIEQVSQSNDNTYEINGGELVDIEEWLVSLSTPPDQHSESLTLRNVLSEQASDKGDYPPSPCCGEPLTPDPDTLAVCVGCGRIWRWRDGNWQPEPADNPDDITFLNGNSPEFLNASPASLTFNPVVSAQSHSLSELPSDSATFLNDDLASLTINSNAHSLTETMSDREGSRSRKGAMRKELRKALKELVATLQDLERLGIKPRKKAKQQTTPKEVTPKEATLLTLRPSLLWLFANKRTRKRSPNSLWLYG